MSILVAENAFVDPRARLADDVEVGPFCVIGPDVEIDAGTRLENNVTLTGRVSIGRHNHIFPGAVLGAEPQDLSYQGSDTRVVIGNHNVIRESVTINRASEKESGVTTVGDHCYLMACSHVAHDCQIGDRVVLANNVMLGGHVHVEDCVMISGGAGVHHFATIGCYSFISGLSRVRQDVPPYMLMDGTPCRPRYVNTVGLKRNQFEPDVIRALTDAFRLIYRSQVGVGPAREVLLGENKMYPAVNALLEFLESQQEGRNGRARERRIAA